MPRKLQPTASTLVVTDGSAAFDTAAEVAAIVQANTANTQFTKLWQKVVPAQQKIRFGSGSPNQQRNQGFLIFFALDVGTDFEEMTIRLVVANALETRSRMVFEFQTQRTHAGTTTVVGATPTDINAMLPLPAQKGLAGEDSLLQIWGKTTVPGTTVDNVTFQIPATIYQ